MYTKTIHELHRLGVKKRGNGSVKVRKTHFFDFLGISLNSFVYICRRKEIEYAKGKRLHRVDICS